MDIDREAVHARHVRLHELLYLVVVKQVINWYLFVPRSGLGQAVQERFRAKEGWHPKTFDVKYFVI